MLASSVRRLEDAQMYAEQALTLTRERGERGSEDYGLRLLGEIHSAHTPPDPDRAEAAIAKPWR